MTARPERAAKVTLSAGDAVKVTLSAGRAVKVMLSVEDAVRPKGLSVGQMVVEGLEASGVVLTATAAVLEAKVVVVRPARVTAAFFHRCPSDPNTANNPPKKP